MVLERFVLWPSEQLVPNYNLGKLQYGIKAVCFEDHET
jgi:hypothetical protein